MEIDWVEPPKRTSGRFKNANDEAMSLGRRKGVWGKLDTYESYRSAHHRAHRIRAGKILGYAMVGTFECKNQQKMELAQWVDELRVEMVNGRNEIGAVIHKRRGIADVGAHYATMPVSVFLDLLKRAGY